MSTGLLGKKLGMTSLYTSEGHLVPVTVVEAGPCVVTQIKTEARDGYNALQLGFGEKKQERVNKPRQGHQKKSGDVCFEHLKEFSVENPDEFDLARRLPLRCSRSVSGLMLQAQPKGVDFRELSNAMDFIAAP